MKDYINTSAMLADGLTKLLGPQLFFPYKTMLGLTRGVMDSG